MEPTATGIAEKDPRVYFAAERTFLAWIRTGLGLMGIGFAVSRFGLFLRQMRATELHLPPHSTGFSLWGGVTLVALGVFVNIASLIQHAAVIRELREGTWVAGRVSRNAIALAAVLAFAGVAMAAYLIVVR